MAVTIGNPTMGEDHVAAQEPYGKDSALVCVCVCLSCLLVEAERVGPRALQEWI